jgi:hypothetical protein
MEYGLQTRPTLLPGRCVRGPLRLDPTAKERRREAWDRFVTGLPSESGDRARPGRRSARPRAEPRGVRTSGAGACFRTPPALWDRFATGLPSGFGAVQPMSQPLEFRIGRRPRGTSWSAAGSGAPRRFFGEGPTFPPLNARPAGESGVAAALCHRTPRPCGPRPPRGRGGRHPGRARSPEKSAHGSAGNSSVAGRGLAGPPRVHRLSGR